MNPNLFNGKGELKVRVNGLIPTSALGTGTANSSTFLRGDGTWATPAGFSWGSSISGTTADGCTITLSNSSDDGAAALKLVAGNTQANQPVLANLQLGTSGNVLGLLIQGTGSGTGGTAGTGKNHVTLWADVADSANILLSTGNGASYTERFNLKADGSMLFVPAANQGTGTVLNIVAPANVQFGLAGVQVFADNTQANVRFVGYSGFICTSGKVLGMCIQGTGSTTGGDPLTGTNHFTLWGSTAGNANKLISCGNGVSYTETSFLTADGNLSLGAAAINSGTQILQVKTGTAPTGQTADSVSFYSSDDAAGHTIPSFYCEGTNVLATGQADSVSSVRVKMRINGTVVTLLAI